MIVAATRFVADTLVDATAGVNVQLAALPIETGAGVPDTTPPAVLTYDATRFAWVARGIIPRAEIGNTPLLLVRGPDEAEIPLWAGEAAGWVPLKIRVAYVGKPSESVTPSDRALFHAYETARAAARCLALKFQNMAAALERNRVSFERPTVVFLSEQEELAGKENILAQLEVTLPSFDRWALGASS